MRSSKSRSRNKNSRQRTLGNIVNRVFDSSGPEGKVRGTPQQIIDKYLTLARDAQLSNDRVAEQSFLQHAEHYTRLLSEAQREMAERQQFNQQSNQNHRQNGDDDRDGDNHNNSNHNGRDNGYRDNNDREQSSHHYDRDEQPPVPQNSAPNEPIVPQAPSEDSQSSNETQQEQPRRGRSRRPKDTSESEAIAQPAEAQHQPVDLGLPAAFAPDDDGENGPVATPETADRPKPRSRAPRSATPRPRKKKEAETGPTDSESGAHTD